MPTDSFDKKATEKFSSDTVRRAERLIDSSPELKKIRSIKDGMKHAEISSKANSQEYRDNWERIFGNKDKPKAE